MMGPGIALTLASGGLTCTLVSRTPDGAEQGVEKARAQAELLAREGLMEEAAAREALGRIAASAEFDASVAKAALVVESGPEDMAWKRDLFARMDAVARPDAVLASNTSGLSITAIGSGCARPERVLTTHFWNPPHLMP
ncbi:MAG TPA: 3-hydroxyacyl-CoA dehydrogenase NAD-binding domain-containing protein, partial [Candidatus Solibacter sp.]|nr:3-hydroxyacyl-CoA dehydrogenase NAD-binding domain-containing protein [Candidatus Solibacter sp.]